jgi:hypothetical protein
MSKEKITENKVIIENGKIKTLFTEETKKRGWMTVKEMQRLLLQRIKKNRELINQYDYLQKYP